MLNSLAINQFVIIDHLVLNLSHGFSVVTGETGAGKSLLLDAIELIVGGKGSPKLVRPGSNCATITASFTEIPKPALDFLAELGINYDGEAIIRRQLFADGRSKAFINDVPVNLRSLSEFGGYLIALHAQHSQQNMLAPSRLLELIDNLAGLTTKRAELATIYQSWCNLNTEISELQEQQKHYLEQHEFLQHAYHELAALNLQPDEMVCLTEQRSHLMNQHKASSKMQALLSTLQSNEGNNILSSLHQAQIQLLKLSSPPEDFPASQYAEELSQAQNIISRVLDHIEQSLPDISDIESQLDKIEERLAEIKFAERKFNRSATALSEYCAELESKLELINAGAERLAKLASERDREKAKFIKSAKAIDQSRSSIITSLLPKLHQELAKLKLAQVRAEISLNPLNEENWHRAGISELSLLVSTNPGQPLMPFGQIASGGEISRFTLAWMVIAGEHFVTPTILFDEIDVGVGGSTATSIGERMRLLASKRQVITVSHQPQVAALANYHLHVEKRHTESSATISARQLSEQERRTELARMLSGAEVTEAAIAAASNLMESI